MSNPNVLIVLPRLQVQNANAISGPMTWGFPAPSAFTGFIHALQRKLVGDLALKCLGVGIVCHKFDPQVTRLASKYAPQVFNLTRNPLTKEGTTAALVEEGRAHIEVSLIITARGRIDSDELEYFVERITNIVFSQRLAGGTLLPQRPGKRYKTAIHLLSSSAQEVDTLFQTIKRRLLPGFALVQREDRLAAHLATLQQRDAQVNALDALLDLTRLNIEPDIPHPDNPALKKWGVRKEPGWLVPIPIGYAAISPLYDAGKVLNARDEQTPFRFVECVYSLGEWISPHRLNSLHQMIWQERANIEQGLYFCENQYANSQLNVHL